ncbi:hypothetical protein JD969_14610 [Planctomycetota bacterium]|nr:hypothetical protein JD969_14610 [Planctomycetota bacterium]
MKSDREKYFPELDEETYEKYEKRAEGWQFRCMKCGHRAHFGKYGVRKHAMSVEKRVLGWCKRCRWVRCLKVDRFK